jgi:hypothetical protein
MKKKKLLWPRDASRLDGLELCLMWVMVAVVVVVVLTVTGRHPRCWLLVVDGMCGDGERWWW